MVGRHAKGIARTNGRAQYDDMIGPGTYNSQSVLKTSFKPTSQQLSTLIRSVFFVLLRAKIRVIRCSRNLLVLHDTTQKVRKGEKQNIKCG